MSSQDTYAAKAAKKLGTEMNRVHKTATEAGKAVVIEIMALADARVNQLEASIERLTKDNFTIKKDNEYLTTNNERLQGKYVALVLEREDHVKGEGTSIKNDPDSAKDRSYELDAEIASLKQDKANISKELDDANDTISSLQEQVDGLEAQLKLQQSMYDSLRKRMSGTRTKPKEEPVDDGTSMVEGGSLALGAGASVEGGTKRKADAMDGDDDLEK
jgi:chromosome segregation ATPase